MIPVPTVTFSPSPLQVVVEPSDTPEIGWGEVGVSLCGARCRSPRQRRMPSSADTAGQGLDQEDDERGGREPLWRLPPLDGGGEGLVRVLARELVLDCLSGRC